MLAVKFYSLALGHLCLAEQSCMPSFKWEIFSWKLGFLKCVEDLYSICKVKNPGQKNTSFVTSLA